MRARNVLERLRAAPLRSFDEIVGPAPVLVLAPHPDDESLGCGGLIAEAARRGHDLRVAVLTDGAKSHPNSRAWPTERLVAARAAEVAAALGILGLSPDRLTLLGEPDGQAPHQGPSFDAALERLATLLRAHHIGTVFASWDQDPHGDHVAAARLVAATGVRVVSYPVWAWTLPDHADIPDVSGRAMRLDVASHLPAKRRAIAAHATQYAGLIDDDPAGFQMTPAFMALFDPPTEVFIEG